MANIAISTTVQAAMDERGIQENDVRLVLDGCGNPPHLCSEDGQRFLAKKRIGNFTVNVEFARTGDSIEVYNVYSHVVRLTGEET